MASAAPDPAVQSIFDGLKAAQLPEQTTGVSWSGLTYRHERPTDEQLMRRAQEIVDGQRRFGATPGGRYAQAMRDIGTLADQMAGHSIRGDAARTRGWRSNAASCRSIIREMRATLLALHEQVARAETAVLEEELATMADDEVASGVNPVFQPILDRLMPRAGRQIGDHSMNGVEP